MRFAHLLPVAVYVSHRRNIRIPADRLQGFFVDTCTPRKRDERVAEVVWRRAIYRTKKEPPDEGSHGHQDLTAQYNPPLFLTSVENSTIFPPSSCDSIGCSMLRIICSFASAANVIIRSSTSTNSSVVTTIRDAGTQVRLLSYTRYADTGGSPGYYWYNVNFYSGGTNYSGYIREDLITIH